MHASISGDAAATLLPFGGNLYKMSIYQRMSAIAGYGCLDPSGMVASLRDFAVSNCSIVTFAPVRSASVRSALSIFAKDRSASFKLA